MSVSYDYSKAQQVEAFAAFLELLSDPKGLAKLFADIKEARASAEEAIAARTKVSEVDAFVVRAEADINKKYDEIEATKAELDKSATVLKKAQADFSDVKRAGENALKEREAKVAAQEVAVAAREVAVAKQYDDLVKREEAVSKREAAAEVQAETLAEKVEAVKRLMGG